VILHCNFEAEIVGGIGDDLDWPHRQVLTLHDARAGSLFGEKVERAKTDAAVAFCGVSIDLQIRHGAPIPGSGGLANRGRGVTQ